MTKTIQTNIEVVNPDYSSNYSISHESLQLLAVLGYEPGDKVFVRCLAPKNSHDDKGGHGDA